MTVWILELVVDDADVVIHVQQGVASRMTVENFMHRPFSIWVNWNALTQT